MRTAFADTFYWVSLAIPTEASQDRALSFAGKIFTEVLTNDHHFEQDGFRALLR